MKVPSFLIQRTNIDTEKKLFFYLTTFGFTVGYTLLSYSSAVFFAQVLNSIWLVGLFLGITNFIAIFLDIPFGYLQKIFSPRTLFLVSIGGLIFTVLIFLLGISHHWIIFLAALTYGLSHDLYGVTSLSWVFKGILPSEYAQNLSQKNVAEALGILVGLILSGAILAFANILFVHQPEYITSLLQITMIMILLFAGFFTYFFFDREKAERIKIKEQAIKTGEHLKEVKNIDYKEQIPHVIQVLSSATISGLKTSAVTILSIAEKSIQAIKGSIEKGEIYLKPITPGEKFQKSKMIMELRDSFEGLASPFKGKTLNQPLMWAAIIIAIFSFWDTFIITFQPLFLFEFLKNAKDSSPYLNGGFIMAIFIIPLFLLQIPFAKLGKRIGREKLITIGLLLSGGSIVLFSFASSLKLLILFGVTNSIGYAMIMPQAQAFFAEKYQEHYAYLHKKSAIDVNVSAGPMKLILNIGNVFGTMFGGFVIQIFGFSAIFFLIGTGLLGLFFYSFYHMDTMKTPVYLLTDEGKEMNEKEIKIATN